MGQGCSQRCGQRAWSPGGRRSVYSQLEEADERAKRLAQLKAQQRRSFCCPCLSWAMCVSCIFVSAILAAVLSVPFWFICHYDRSPSLSQVGPLVDKRLEGREVYTWWNTVDQKKHEYLAECAGKLANVTEVGELRYGFAPAEQAARLMYKCSQIPGHFEAMPSKLKGVFWTKGQGPGQELVVLQNGQWFKNEKTLLVPYSPWMWAWAKSTPKEAFLQSSNRSADGGWKVVFALAELRPSMSLVFQDCPTTWQLPAPLAMPGHMCEKGMGGRDVTFAKLQFHLMGNLHSVHGIEEYTLEELDDGVEPGARWYRGNYGGLPFADAVLGQCRPFSQGGYHLTKILDEDGHPLEPAFSEFLQYMGDVPLFLWAGKANNKDAAGSTEDAQKRKQDAAAQAAAARLVVSPYF